VAPVRRGRFQLSANPRLHFEPVPGLAYDGEGPPRFYEWRGRSNRLGYRDREWTVGKPAGVYRVVVLGDSIAAGYRVEERERAFPALLERRLEGAGGSGAVEVLNFAVTGYNTDQEVETLRARALAFSPDLVLLAYCHNDRRPADPRILAALREAADGRRPVAPPAAADRALAWSALYRLARWGLPSDDDTGGTGGGAAGRTWAADESWERVERPLGELAALARAHDFEVLLAVFPYLPRLYDRRHAAHHAHLAALARRHGFHHLDLRPAFRECRGAGAGKLGFDRYHPTAAGQACAAEALAEAVRKVLRAG
jgi:lysophospholipase L1-like esterase